MHTATIANFTLWRQQMQNAYLFEMLDIQIITMKYIKWWNRMLSIELSLLV